MSQESANIFIGVDEAGRGCLAGPVVSASVAIYEDQVIEGVNDSKLLSPKKRDDLYDVIQNECLSFSVASIDNHVIDQKNILVATLQSMKDSIRAIGVNADEIIIDGPHKPVMNDQRDLITRGVIGGDKLFHCVSAASIIAKVYRDKFMIELHHKYPKYNFQKNKGYPTKDHIQAIRELGPSPYHRLSFKPELYENES
ncbi:MAG: ribonuclease HII [Pseudomonadota bacterium]|nr:ribonuclease HII [Pseudomonadota bacterium]